MRSESNGWADDRGEDRVREGRRVEVISKWKVKLMRMTMKMVKDVNSKERRKNVKKTITSKLCLNCVLHKVNY